MLNIRLGSFIFFIFGWGHTKFKDFGPALQRSCENCNNEKFWHLCKSSVWFTLFFIPIFPYKNDKLLLCPVCQSGLILTNEDFEEIAPIAEANLSLAKGEITESEHVQLIAQINSANQNKLLPS